MSESGKIDKELYIHRFLSGAMSDAERLAFADWLDGSDTNRKMYDEISSIWNASLSISEIQSEFDYKSAFEKHKARLVTEKSQPSPIPKILNFTSYRNFLIAAAAILVMLMAILVLIPEVHKPELYLADKSSLNIALPDKSEVWLNAGSELQVMKFDNNQRKVELKGTAFFDVTKSDTKKFRVKAGELNIDVLGTEFMVNADNGYVWLKSGAIRISVGEKFLDLTPGQTGVFSDGNLILSDSVPINSMRLDWVNEDFSFNNAPLKNVIRDIELKYGITIRIDNDSDISLCYFTSGSLKPNTLNEVFRILQLSFDMEVTESSTNTYTLSSIVCK